MAAYPALGAAEELEPISAAVSTGHPGGVTGPSRDQLPCVPFGLWEDAGVPTASARRSNQNSLMFAAISSYTFRLQ